MPKRDPYLRAITQTCIDLFRGGLTNVSAGDIAAAHHPGEDTPQRIAFIRDRLLKLRDELEETTELGVCPLSGVFFDLYATDPPQTREEARRCLPGGRGKRTQGLHLNRVDGDLIYEEALRRNMASGAGKIRKNADRALSALEDGRMTESATRQVIQEGQRRQIPSSPERAEQVRALTEGDD